MKNKLYLITILLLSAYLIYSYKSTHTYADNLQESISEKILRFHVVANSDTDDDQALKLKVRDEVLAYITPKLSASSSLNETLTIIENESTHIQSVAAEIVSLEGYNYPVNVEITNCYFPMKTYGDMILPPGEYQALKITIGEGVGHNWWCVMYPNICFVGNSTAVMPDESKEKLQHILTDEEYCSIFSNSDSKDDIKINFTSHFSKWFN
jgi:stage II sporulation protein R